MVLGKADGINVLPSKNCYSGTGVITISCKVGDIFLCVGYDGDENLMLTCISGGTVYTANNFTNKTTGDLKSYYNGSFRLVVATGTTIKFQLPTGSTTFSGTVFALQK